MTDLSIVDQLINEANEAAKKASKELRPAHKKALNEARKLRDDLAVSTSNEQTIQECVDIIETATDNRNLSPDSAAAIAAQYISSITSIRQVDLETQQSGKYWLGTLPRFMSDWKPAQRTKILDAFVMGCQGKIDAGLVEFPESLVEALDLDTAKALAEIAAPEWFSDLMKKQAELAVEFGKAQGFVDALEQATPRLFTAKPNGDETISVLSNRPGSVSAGGIRFNGGTITALTGDQFNQVRNDKFFKSYLESGVLQMTTSGSLAAEI